MQTIIVDGRRARLEYAALLNEMYYMRARVFYERLGWDVDVIQWAEIDAYDSLPLVYVLVVEGERLMGSVRMMPTTGPTLLADMFADTYPDIARLQSQEIWEVTRFCGLDVMRSVLLGAARVALRRGITTLLGVCYEDMVRRCSLAGVEFDVLGENSAGIILVSFPISEEVINNFANRGRQK